MLKLTNFVPWINKDYHIILHQNCTNCSTLSALSTFAFISYIRSRLLWVKSYVNEEKCKQWCQQTFAYRDADSCLWEQKPFCGPFFFYPVKQNRKRHLLWTTWVTCEKSLPPPLSRFRTETIYWCLIVREREGFTKPNKGLAWRVI